MNARAMIPPPQERIDQGRLWMRSRTSTVLIQLGFCTFNASDTFAASADLFDVNVVFLAFLDWLRAESVCAATITTSPFITHRHVPPPLFVCSRFGCYGRKQRSLR